jgi:hypothetical protein
MSDRTTRPTTSATYLAGLCALLATAGCFSLARPTPPLEEFVLGESPPTTAAAPAGDSHEVTIGLRRLDLAPYLATTAIVTRRGARIVTSEFHRWGVEPGAGIMRAVRASLGAAPTIAGVDIAPWKIGVPHDYLVQLHVSHLEGVAADQKTAMVGEVRVGATWEILRAQDGTLVARGETDHREAGWMVGDYAGLVARVDKALAGLAGDLAWCLTRVAAAPAVPDSSTVGSVVECRTR